MRLDDRCGGSRVIRDERAPDKEDKTPTPYAQVVITYTSSVLDNDYSSTCPRRRNWTRGSLLVLSDRVALGVASGTSGPLAVVQAALVTGDRERKVESRRGWVMGMSMAGTVVDILAMLGSCSEDVDFGRMVYFCFVVRNGCLILSMVVADERVVEEYVEEAEDCVDRSAGWVMSSRSLRVWYRIRDPRGWTGCSSNPVRGEREVVAICPGKLTSSLSYNFRKRRRA